MGNSPGARVALVHDFLGPTGGPERVLQALAGSFPKAMLFTLTYRPVKGPLRLPTEVIALKKTLSALDKVSFLADFRKVAFGTRAIEAFDFQHYDVVISSSSGLAVGAQKRPGAFHICYVHGLLDVSTGMGRLLREGLLAWERRAFEPSNVDFIVADSELTAKNLEIRTGRKADAILPGWVPDRVDSTGTAVTSPRSRHFITTGPLVSYKRLETVLSAFQMTGLPLLIVGAGPEQPRLRKRSPANVEWVGALSTDAVRDLMRKSRGFVTASTEGFQLAAAEARALGVPVFGGANIDPEGLAQLILEEQGNGEYQSGEFLSQDQWQAAFQTFIKTEGSFSGKDVRVP